MKLRLDELLLNLKLVESLEKARALIGAGEVYIADEKADKAGVRYSVNAPIRLKKRQKYVSRGGLKLEAGLDAFTINPKGFICADIGASTGGFTDCLLQRGALKVYAIDVAYGQLDWKLRNNPKVVVFERFNARNLGREHIPDPIDLAVVDASFISLSKLLPPLLPLFREEISIVALIKPQFEIAKNKLEPGGVVLEKELHEEVIGSVISNAERLKLTSQGVVPSPIKGPKGNQEFLIHLTT